MFLESQSQSGVAFVLGFIAMKHVRRMNVPRQPQSISRINGT